MNKIYDFTNENISVFKDIYSFDKAKVLTVVGSGDQYLNALLNGAKQVDVFDINYLAYVYMELKIIALKHLKREDFLKFFVTDNLNNLEIYLKIHDYLPKECSSFFDELIKLKRLFSSIKCDNTIFNHRIKETIPYFEENNYYKLQEILNKSKLPFNYNCDFLDLKNKLHENYDIILLSNIYHYIPLNVLDFKKYLLSFDSQCIQALYTWILDKKERKEFLHNDFVISEVPSVISKKSNDYVITLKRKK